jgi:hypothetical protein
LELTKSYERVFPDEVKARYAFAEVRNAAAAMSGGEPEAFAQLVQVLQEFHLTLDSLVEPGGNKGPVARYFDGRFREFGWREGGHTSETVITFKLQPYKKAGEKQPVVKEYRYTSGGHRVDNVRSRVALEVEWNAKDGNLDRDLNNFRALHEAGAIDVAVIITREQERTKWAANKLAELANRIRYKPNGQRVVPLGTTTTTNLENLIDRLQRGEAGGCPVVAVAITDRCYQPAEGEPALPPYEGPVEIEGEPEAPPPDDDAP